MHTLPLALSGDHLYLTGAVHCPQSCERWPHIFWLALGLRSLRSLAAAKWQNIVNTAPCVMTLSGSSGVLLCCRET